MTHAGRMVRTNPSGAPVDESVLVECIEACFDCAQACTACADACLGEDDPGHLVCCIRLDLDCADVCDATGRVLSRQTAFEPRMARAALGACAEECEKHAEGMGMEHCRVCAEACRRCERSCNDVISALAA